MTDPDIDIQAMLRTLLEQQTALLGAHAESMRLQRVLLERLLGLENPPALTVQATAPTVATPNSHLESGPEAASASIIQVPAQQETPPDVGQPADIIATVAESQLDEDQASVNAPGERQSLRVTGGTPVRGERYYQSPQRTERASTRPVSLEALDVLRGIQAAGDVAHLILTFGPHAGETLGQVAQSDPDYLRRLAIAAQRPDVRAAAARLVSALPSNLPVHGRQTPEKPRRGMWRGAS